MAVVSYMQDLLLNLGLGGGLHEKHVVATWHLGYHLSICSWTQENQEKPASRWPVAGPSGPCPLDSSLVTNIIKRHVANTHNAFTLKITTIHTITTMHMENYNNAHGKSTVTISSCVTFSSIRNLIQICPMFSVLNATKYELTKFPRGKQQRKSHPRIREY